MTIKELTNRIENLKEGKTLAELKSEDIQSYYTVKSLASKLSDLKAHKKGNFVTKEDLVEYKGLIIFLIKKSLYRTTNTNSNLKVAMTYLLNEIEGKKVVFKTKRGIKGIVSKMAKRIGLEVSEDVLCDYYGADAWLNGQASCYDVKEDFQNHRLNILM